MTTRRLVLMALLSCQLIFLPNTTKGQSRSQTIETNPIRVSITVEDHLWSKGKAALVTVRLENLAERDIKVRAGYSFYLTNMNIKEPPGRRAGDSFTSPAAMVRKKGQLQMISDDPDKAIVIKRTRTSTISRSPNEAFHLRKGEVKQITVDLSRFLWGDQMQSVYPNQHFFDLIPEGRYYLQFDITSGKNQRITSNQIEVQVA